MMNRKMDRETLNWLLSFNYQPDIDAQLPEVVIRSLSADQVDGPEHKLIDEGAAVLDTVFDSAIERWDDGGQHVVPLSSGLDSRCILSGLLDRINPDRIQTVTFGIEGTWDFEFGQQVAEVAGVSNQAIDLASGKFDWSYEGLLDSAAAAPHPVRLPDFHVNRRIADYIDDDSWTLWSGYMGDPSAGAHLPKDLATTWDEAVTEFIDWNTLTDLSSPDFRPVDLLPDEPLISKSQLSYREQLDFAIRQPSFIKQLTTPHEWVTPFELDEWLSFALNLAPRWRHNRSLFKTIMAEKWPEFFMIPSDESNGLPLTAGRVQQQIAHYYQAVRYRIRKHILGSRFHPNRNYIDYASAFRDDALLRDPCKRFVEAVDQSPAGGWISGTDIWHEHQQGDDNTLKLKSLLTTGAYLIERGFDERNQI